MMSHHAPFPNSARRCALAMIGLALLVGCNVAEPSPPPSATPLARVIAATQPPATLTVAPPTVAARDSVPPIIRVEPIPARVAQDDGLKIVAAAEDKSGVARLALSVDGQPIIAVAEGVLRYNLDTRRLAPGPHLLVLEAQDGVGNLAQAQLAFEIAPPPTAAATPTPTARPTQALTASPSASPTATPSAVAAPTARPVVIERGEITIGTYAYEQALYTDADKAGHPYPLLRRDRVGAPRPRAYQTIILRNEYLELTLLPELGGRIYQVRYLPSGQPTLYNNTVIKPTHWGPLDQGWWLAVGGIEFCLPVDEHGYVTAEPWSVATSRQPDGSVVATARIIERSRQIGAQVAITLRPGEAGFHLRSTLVSQSDQPQRLQYWINAMLSPGGHGVQPTLRFYYPASEVIVHSRGDRSLPDAHGVLAWPIHQGRDLSLYANWRDWLGFFAPTLSAPFTAVYDDAAQLGMVRVFPPEVARGVKLFAFGQGFGDVGAYTDDGSQYVEMWGGLTPTFWDDATLQPGATIGWEETWYVIARSGGPSVANEQAALSASVANGRLAVTVAAVSAQSWTLRVTQGDRELTRQPCVVRPDAPFALTLPLPEGNPAGRITVEVLSARGEIVVSYSI